MMRQSAKAPRKSKRLELRAPADVKRTIKRAADIRGNSVSDFVLNNARDAALRVIEEYEELRLREEDRSAFFSALLNPPEPTTYAKAAFKRYRAMNET